MKAIYYPYSICIDKNALKIMLLLFEQVYFLDSKPDEITKLSREFILKIDSDLEIAYEYAKEKNAISIYNPKDILKEYDFLISKTVFDDVRDDDFIFAASTLGISDCSVTNDRLPESYEDFFRATGLTYIESLELQRIIGEKIRLGIDKDVQIKSLRFPKIRMGEALDLYKNYGFNNAMSGSFRISPPQVTFRYIPHMHFLSLRINEAMLVANKLGACIVTDNSIVQRLYEIRLNRIKNGCFDDVVDFKKYKISFNDIQVRVAYELFNEIISTPEFEQLSIQDVIDFRTKNLKQLEKLWEQIDIIASEINDNQGYDIYVTVHKRLREVNTEKEALANDFWKLAKTITIQSAGIIAPVISANVAIGSNLETIFVSSAVAELGYLTATGIEHVLEATKILSSSRNNSFSYLIDCKSAKPANLVRKQLKKRFDSQIDIKGIDDDLITLVLLRNESGQYICYPLKTTVLETYVFVGRKQSINTLDKTLRKYTLIEPVVSNSLDMAIVETCKGLNA